MDRRKGYSTLLDAIDVALHCTLYGTQIVHTNVHLETFRNQSVPRLRVDETELDITQVRDYDDRKLHLDAPPPDQASP